MRRSVPRLLVLSVAGALASAGVVLLPSAPASALAPVNPVEVDLAGHPANSGFLVFVENDVYIRSDESEGTMAMGGDFRVASTYQVAAGSRPVRDTYVDAAAGDTTPTYLHVGGGIRWEEDGAQVRVENGGLTKVAEAGTYTAHDTDSNGAAVNYRLTEPGRPYESVPFVEGRSRQSPASVGSTVPRSLIDISSAFGLYRDLTQQMAACPQTVGLVDDQGSPIKHPFPANTRGRLTLVPGQTNVLSLSAADLRDLSEVTFTNQPSASTPLLVNVTGAAYDGNTPNLAGIGGSQAPYILWNFPDATTVRVTGGASIEGTLYAPNATLNWVPTQNVEGNVIAKNFYHGQLGRSGTVREVHDFPFSTTLSCSAAPTSGRLTLVKQVVNDHGGTATAEEWTLAAGGPATIEGTTGSPDVTGVEVPPGIYDLAEAGGPLGYRPSAWTCTGGAVVDGMVTVGAGSDVTCTIVNHDQPAHLTLAKQVVNDDGGTAGPGDWILTADGPTPLRGRSGDDAVTRATVDAGRYDLAEEGGPDGYTATGWVCRELRSRSSATGTVELTPGADVTCVVTNDDDATSGGGGDQGPPGDGGPSSGSGAPSTPSVPSAPSSPAPTTAATSPTSALPDTGSPISPWLVALGSGLVTAGAVLLIVSRRRRP